MADVSDASQADSASLSAGTLFVVATPIGNLGDITLRALEVLKAAPVVAAEDTRRTRQLLTHFGLRARLISYHAHNRRARTGQVLEALSRGDVALVTDAGTPVISDPGQELVRAAAGAGHRIVPVPGPSALAAALSVAGLDAATVHFLGFLPRRTSERRRTLERAAAWPGVMVLFEAPHRLVATLTDLHAVAGDRAVAVCGDLTKFYEAIFRGTLAEARAHFQAGVPRGEFTLVVGGAPETGVAPVPPPVASLEARFAALERELGDRKRALTALARETGQPRKALYARFLAGSVDAGPAKCGSSNHQRD